jgi:predicted aspartyl protease
MMRDPQLCPAQRTIFRLAVLLPLVKLLTVFQSPGYAAEPQPDSSIESYLKRLGYAPIVLERDDKNMLFLRTTFKGKKQRTTLDTGASVTLIDQRLAPDLKRVEQLEDSYLGIIRGPDLVILESLKLGDVEFKDQPAFLAKMAPELGDRCILGCDFLARNNAIIDCFRRRLYIRAEAPPPQIRAALGESLGRSGCAAVRTELSPGQPLCCAALVNGAETKMVVDTGASYNMLDATWARQQKLALTHTYARVMGQGDIGSHEMQLTQARSLQLGEIILPNIYFGVSDLEAWGLSNRGKWMPEAKGLLGADTLAGNGALIDFATMQIWLRKPKPAK